MQSHYIEVAHGSHFYGTENETLDGFGHVGKSDKK